VTPCCGIAPPPFAAAALFRLLTRKVAVKELDQADRKLDMTLDEVNTIDVFCLKPRPARIDP
jgi:hypothetical protein